LKLVEFLPDNCIADSGRSIDNLILIELVFTAAKQTVKNKDINEIRVAVTRYLMK
jgi:hypothetical protein